MKKVFAGQSRPMLRQGSSHQQRLSSWHPLKRVSSIPTQACNLSVRNVRTALQRVRWHPPGCVASSPHPNQRPRLGPKLQPILLLSRATPPCHLNLNSTGMVQQAHGPTQHQMKPTQCHWLGHMQGWRVPGLACSSSAACPVPEIHHLGCHESREPEALKRRFQMKALLGAGRNQPVVIARGVSIRMSYNFNLTSL